MEILSQGQLIQQLSSTIGKTKVAELSRILTEQQFLLRDLIDITFHTDHKIGFRAAWLLEVLLLKRPESYVDDLDYLLLRFYEVSNPCCMRHYTKIIMHLTAAKAPAFLRSRLQNADLSLIVEQLFDWLISPKTKIAVKAFAASALFNLKSRFDWVSAELQAQLLIMANDRSPGIRSRAKNLLASF